MDCIYAKVIAKEIHRYVEKKSFKDLHSGSIIFWSIYVQYLFGRRKYFIDANIHIQFITMICFSVSSFMSFYQPTANFVHYTIFLTNSGQHIKTQGSQASSNEIQTNLPAANFICHTRGSIRCKGDGREHYYPGERRILFF